MSTKKVSESVTPTGDTPFISKSIKELAKEKIKELIAEESKIVKGIFQCFETPGATVKIVVRKYAGPPFEKTMTDGEMYDVPLYVARHLNGVDVSAGAVGPSDLKNPLIGTCSYPVHGFTWKQGQSAPTSQMGQAPGFSGIPVPIVGIAKRVKRFGFQSMEFGSSLA